MEQTRWWQTARKALVAAVIAGLAAFTPAMIDNGIDAAEVALIVTAAVGAGIAVYATPNRTG